MQKLIVTLYGKEYTVNCGEGEEGRLRELVSLVENRMRQVSDRAGNTTESRLLMLTCLFLADELIEARKKAGDGFAEEEELFVAAIDHLKNRVAHIASQMGQA